MYGIALVLGLTAQCLVHALPSSSLTGKQLFLSSETESIQQDRSTTRKIPQTARQLTGKFLHITDFHPDPYYKPYSSTDDESLCHRSKGPAGYYGAETSGCDSPIHLINSTFAWLKEHLRDEVDFVIWTGDSARHDNDEGVPRSSKQIVEQNAFIVEKWRETFGKKENWDDDDPNNDFVVPIIPTLGNNDVMPHNIFEPGPNAWTSRYLDMWRQFIPEEQRHQFQRGGWFSVEVIPNKLVVFSLNTLYFFASNSAVDGCAKKSEPGYEQFDWLRVQLNMLRSRGMKAIIIGHVPPARVDAKVSWVESCWQKYALWMRMYRDVVVTGLYGHMNLDHFMLQDWEDVKGHVRRGIEYDSDDDNGVEESPSISIMSAQDYLVSLRDKFARVPLGKSKDVKEMGDVEDSKKRKKKHGKLHKKPNVGHIGGKYGDRYSVSLVAPSVIPNYFPTLRIYEYNITGLENVLLPAASSYHRPPHDHDELDLSSHTTSRLDLRSIPQHDDEFLEDYVQSLIQNPPSTRFHADKKKKRKKKPKAHKFRLPKAPSKSTPPGPAYSPQSLTITSYTQYYANLTHLNNDYIHDKPKKDKGVSDLSDSWPQQLFEEHLDVFGDVEEDKWRPGKHHGKKPPKKTPDPKPFAFEVEYNTTDDKIFGLKDLTVRSFLDLAARIAASKKGGKSEPAIEVFENQDDDEEVDGYVLVNEAASDDKHKNHKNHVWLMFLKRAFVSTVDEDELENQFEI
jgi:endopolyphosphatase